MSYIREIDTRMWSDSKFCTLSRPPPNAQTLWFYLLTGPETTQLPGVLRMGKAHLAEALDWSVEETMACFGELERAGMALADWKHRLMWLPNALRYKTLNASWVGSWSQEWDGLPECPLKLRIWKAWSQAVRDLAASNPKHEPTMLSFQRALPEPSYNATLAAPPPSPPPWGTPRGGQDPVPAPGLVPVPPPREDFGHPTQGFQQDPVGNPCESGEEEEGSPGDQLWSHWNSIRQQERLPLTLHRPEKWNTWAEAAAREHGLDSLHWAITRFMVDPFWAADAWPAPVFMKPTVYERRLGAPPRQRRAYG